LLLAIKAVKRGEMPLHPRVAQHLFAGRTGRSAPAKTDQLTNREKDVLELIARGMTNKEVADALNLSQGTVKAHVSRILGKLEVSSRTEAAMLAVQLGLVSIDANPNSPPDQMT
jgi:DNA-binding NarL/FixJ family response regulator